MVVRSGENVLTVVEAVKKKIAELAPSFPPGVKLEVAYDRTDLIRRAIDTLRRTLIEEMIVVALVIVALPLPFPLRPRADHGPADRDRDLVSPDVSARRVSSNIMSLGGLALAIGVLVDASIVMVENAHRHLASVDPAAGMSGRESAIVAASQQVGRPIFFSLIIIVVSFLPVFLLTGEEGRLFHPLAFTKTFAIAAASLLSVTLVPILMVVWMRGHIRPEEKNPVAMFFRRLYAPVLNRALRFPKTTLVVNFLLVPAVVPLALSLGSEFMPPLREGSVMYMPTGLPMMSVEQARDVLVRTDGIIRTFPEVQSVLGKAGKVESSTDPAPMEMFETTIVLKPRAGVAEGVSSALVLRSGPTGSSPLFRPIWPEMRPATQDELVTTMNEKLQVPGNAGRLDPADPQPPRHARDRRSDPRRREGIRRGLLRHREGEPRRRERPERPSRTPAACTRSGRPAGPTSTSPWTATRRRATGSP